MTEEIKKRIEQIKRGEVPQGYQKTKVGVVPSEWDICNLSPYIVEYRELTNDINRYPLYSSSRKGLLPQSDYFDKKEAVETHLGYKIVPCGYVTYRHMSDDDIFHFNINNTGKEILVSSEYPVFTTQRMNLIYLIESLNNMPRFRYFCRAQKMGGTRTRLYLNVLKQYKSPVPPFLEQEKIAEILTACDKVIELKGKLIAEKQRQKKYLMQNLLTGKIRLKGFTNEWKNFKLGSAFSERIEINNIDLPLLAITGTRGVIPRSELNLKDNSSEDKSKYLRICPDDIGYNTMRMWQGVSALSNYEGIVSPAYTILKPNNTINARCFSYLFKLPQIVFLFYRYSQGLVADTRNLKYSNFRRIKVTFSDDKVEQTAIANILSTADREIELLQKDLDQWKQKKKALMQLLLTGIVRVKTDGKITAK